MTLRIQDVLGVRGPLRGLLTIGVLTTWTLATLAARFIIGIDWSLSLLVGAILIVTGPTVVIPLLNQIRPTAQVRTILRWEGIIIDPIGALIAVLVFEAILVADLGEGVLHAARGILLTVLIGLVVGYVIAGAMLTLFSRNLVPEHLHNPVTLGSVVVALTVSNLVQAESGLLTVTVMGIVIANQESLSLPGIGWQQTGEKYESDVKNIIDFAEDMQLLLLSTVFILLAARLKLEDFQALGLSDLTFIAVLMLVVRPTSVFLSTIGSSLSFKEKIFLSWMAPRGIVAAAVASIFALELSHNGKENVELLVPLVFSVITATVIIYSLTGRPLAKWLGVAQESPQGVLIVGAHTWARAIARAIRESGYRVLIVDTNYANIQQARMDGLPVFFGSVLSNYTADQLDLTGIGRLLALTPNDEVNALATLKYARLFGSRETYQLAPRKDDDKSRSQTVSAELSGRILFGSDLTFRYLDTRWRLGATIKTTKLSPEFDEEEFRETYNQKAVPLFVITAQRELKVYTADQPPQLTTQSNVISLLDEPKTE
jgi:NhaP-type Na+/H+ or K+/H+ antiporter